MDPIVAISEHTEFLDRLGSSLPGKLHRRAGASRATQPIVLRFTYRDVPFIGLIEHAGTAPILRLSGEVGPLPFTVQSSRRRRRALITLAAGGGPASTWQVSAQQQITVAGTIALSQPLTPAATVAGAVQLLLQGDRCLSLLLDVLGDADGLNSVPAA